MAAFCATTRDTILATGLFELGAVRVRAFRADDYAIADLMPENSFLDMVFPHWAGAQPGGTKSNG